MPHITGDIRRTAENTRNYTIKAGGRDVGDLQLYKESSDSLNVTWVGVDDSERGRGFATAAMVGAMEIARQSGCKHMTLEVPGNSPDARHIYEKLGFVPLQQISSDDDVWGGLTSMRLDFDDDGNVARHSELCHYGILGMKWGVRRFQNPDGSYTAAGKERYGSGNGNGPKEKSEASSGKSSGSGSKEERFWTDDRKRIARNVAIGAAVVTAVGVVGWQAHRRGAFDGTTSIGRSAVDEARLDAPVGILGFDDISPTRSLEALEDSIGPRDSSFELTIETARKTAAKLNPSKSATNCGAVATAGLLNSVGFNVEAVGVIPADLSGGLGGKGLNPERIPDLFRGADVKRVTQIGEQNGVRIGGPKSAYEAMRKHLESYGLGASGYIFGEKTSDGRPGHYFRWAVLEDGLHVLEGQPPTAQKEGIDWFGDDVYKNVFRLFQPDEMSVTSDIRGGLLDGSVVAEADLVGELVRGRG